MPPFKAPTHNELRTEQERVQEAKFQGRQLAHYSARLFPGQNLREPRPSAVAELVGDYAHDGRVSIDSIIRGKSEELGRPVHWVDMGGGRALAMRQLAAGDAGKRVLKMTNIDLIDHGLEGLRDEEIDYLEKQAPGMTAPAAQPEFIESNSETVELKEPADVITCVEGMQYLNNPLGAFCNWYNQLADDGLMMIATEHEWASWIRHERGSGKDDYVSPPMLQVVEELEKAGILFAATDSYDEEKWPRKPLDMRTVRTMVVQKKPETSLQLNATVEDVWVNHWDFKAVYYTSPPEGPMVEVVSTP